jgi:hypothetical protein
MFGVMIRIRNAGYINGMAIMMLSIYMDTDENNTQNG